MLSWITRWRALGFGASCLVHLGLIAGVLATERWILSVADTKPPVLLAEVVTISDAPPTPEAIIKKATPKPASRSMFHLPKPVLTPPQTAEAVTPSPPPSRATAETQAQPALSPPTGGSMTTVTEPASSSGPPGDAPAAPSNSSKSASAVASAPSHDAGSAAAITRSARPQGGYQVRPSYPSSALRQGIQGTTMLKVHVLIDGRVGDVVVQQSAGHPDLDQAAIDAVRRWRFEPARRGNDPVAMWVLLPVEFQIR
jgi:protein TonB